MRDFVAEQFARDWVAAWNCADAEAVLAHVADDVLFVSPLAAKVTGQPEVRGKAALRAYWTKALASLSAPPKFSLASFVWDEPQRALLILYVSTEQERTTRKCELMYFGANGLIHRGEGFVGTVVG